MNATNQTRRRPPREGIRQLATREAMRTLVRRPRWFFANLRQGPEFLRDQRLEMPAEQFAEHLTTEAAAVAAVLGVEESEYERARAGLWIPQPDPDEPLNVWNAREELLGLVGAIVRLMRPRVMVETGVALGFTTATVLRAMRENDCGRLYSVDLPALQYDPGDPVGRAVPEELGDRWELTLGDSRIVLGPLVERVAPLDVFLHDALHTYTSQLREYRTAWPHLRSGGVLVSDDVGNPAFVEFAREVGAVAHLVGGPTRASAVGVMRKP
jgi:predicted O-methyltransferase YrrM